MRYLGGKSRVANDISQVINRMIGNRTFVSIFCGGCAVEAKVNANRKIIADCQPYLIEMWKDLQKNRIFPEQITVDQYYEVKNNIDADKGLSGYIGFGCSFSGKWFGGPARDKKGADFITCPKQVYKDIQGLKDAEFICCNYHDIVIPDNSLVYADPPYFGTTGYGMDFDHEEFWRFIREESKRNIVLVSEMQAPEDFKAIWVRDIQRQVDVNQPKQNSVEKLFVYNDEVV